MCCRCVSREPFACFTDAAAATGVVSVVVVAVVVSVLCVLVCVL